MSVSPYQHIRTIEDVKRVSGHLGGHFFDPAAMRFFNSRTLGDYYPVTTDVDSETGAVGYFVTSERDTYSDRPRLYSVRKFECQRNPNPRPGREGDHVQDITTVDFQDYTTAREAKARAKAYAESDKERD